MSFLDVIPAKAGIHNNLLDARFHGHDKEVNLKCPDP